VTNLSQDIGNDSSPADISGLTFDPSLLADLTRVLLPFLGPYSITTVKRAARSAESAGELLRHVANHIDETAKREVFMKAARRIVSDYQLEHGDDGSHDGHENDAILQAQNKSGTAAPDAATDNANAPRPLTPITAELIQRGEAALAPIIGPLAGVLASRYATRASSSREFFDRLAGHLRTPEERDTFFLSVRTGNGTWNL
jgi:hypothetical protein